MDKTKLLLKYYRNILLLSKSNYLTGVWDNRRFSLCKKPFEQFSEEDKAFLYKTEKRSRYHVEQRAVARNYLETIYSKLINQK